MKHGEQKINLIGPNFHDGTSAFHGRNEDLGRKPHRAGAPNLNFHSPPSSTTTSTEGDSENFM
jgi:hypothetical protein